MNNKIHPPSTSLRSTPGCQPGSPLWQRVPKRDESGRLLSDFMMLIPGLGKHRQENLEAKVNALGAVLERYAHVVVYADLNLKLNVLWVSIRPEPGIFLELPAAIRHVIPEALLVAHSHNRS
jgi:hypothetical protein